MAGRRSRSSLFGIMPRVALSIIVVFGWLIFTTIHIAFLAKYFNLFQNIAIFIVASLLGIAILAVTWASWAAEFAKGFGRAARKFPEEEWKEWGERFGKKMERKGKEWEKGWKGWWFRTFGFVGPFVSGVFGFVCLVVGIWILSFVNVTLQSSFISLLTSAILRNLHWFLVASLFFAYDDYFEKMHRHNYWIVKPVTGGLRLVFIMWIGIWLLKAANAYSSSHLVTAVVGFLAENFWGIFVLFVVLGYVFVSAKKIFWDYL